MIECETMINHSNDLWKNVSLSVLRLWFYSRVDLVNFETLDTALNVGMMFWFGCFVSITPDVTESDPSRKVPFALISPNSIFPEVFKIIRIIFGKYETDKKFVVFLGQQWFWPLNSEPLKAICAPSLFLLLSHYLWPYVSQILRHIEIRGHYLFAGLFRLSKTKVRLFHVQSQVPMENAGLQISWRTVTHKYQKDNCLNMN